MSEAIGLAIAYGLLTGFSIGLAVLIIFWVVGSVYRLAYKATGERG